MQSPMQYGLNCWGVGAGDLLAGAGIDICNYAGTDAGAGANDRTAGAGTGIGIGNCVRQLWF